MFNLGEQRCPGLVIATVLLLQSSYAATQAVGPNLNLTAASGNQYEPAVAINPSNNKQLFAVARNEIGGLYTARSSDGGSTWTRQLIARVSTPVAGDVPRAYGNPSVAWDNFDNLFLTYLCQSTIGAPTYVCLAFSNDGGMIAVTWYDARDSALNNTTRYFGAFSSDGGATFTTNFPIATGMSDQANSPAALKKTDYGDYTGNAFAGGVLVPVWADNSNSTGDNPEGATTFDVYTAIVQAPDSIRQPALVLPAASPGCDAFGAQVGVAAGTWIRDLRQQPGEQHARLGLAGFHWEQRADATRQRAGDGERESSGDQLHRSGPGDRSGSR